MGIRSFVATGRMAMMRSISYKRDIYEKKNDEQKEEKYLYFEMFYGGQKLHKYFRSFLIKDTSLLTC